MKTFYKATKGFTFTEIIIVLGILTLLLSIVTVAILQSQRKATLSARLSTLVSDVRAQQFQAMSSDTGQSGEQKEYGVHFESDSYTLFTGSSYNSSDTNNFVVSFDDDVIFENITFPGGNIVFNKVSGEISGYNETLDTITLRDLTNNENKTLEFNSLGVLAEIQ